MSANVRQVFMGLDETETPADLQDGETVEAIRLGGPRDGGRIGYFVVELLGDGEVRLRPLDDAKRENFDARAG